MRWSPIQVVTEPSVEQLSSPRPIY